MLGLHGRSKFCRTLSYTSEGAIDNCNICIFLHTAFSKFTAGAPSCHSYETRLTLTVSTNRQAVFVEPVNAIFKRRQIDFITMMQINIAFGTNCKHVHAVYMHAQERI